MTYQWNPDKAIANLRKHGIDFADAVSVFSDDLAITIEDERFDEERFITIGLDFFGRILVIVHTWRGKATRTERQQYMDR
ncbi:MAG: BrnT family toxin [Crocosphaera sp.]